MDSKPIIELRNVGKKYNITHMRGGYIALRDVLMNIIRAPLAFLKIKAKQVSGFEKKEDFWALRDVSFRVEKGEVVGIIGSNGAGKSTLLKILSQITPPTEGEAVLRGRVGSLLEVGTGFHPELTGRENIFLNGAILGMKKKEIVAKFDEIVAFAGIEKFLDTPVKYYSSGMYVRLAFSVAAHMEPDILMVDEVLAVGDAEFQKKCLGKMDEITKREGRTIIFVSHNMGAIKQLCNRAILLKQGKIVLDGDPNYVIQEYLSLGADSVPSLNERKDRKGDGKIKFTNLEIIPPNGRGCVSTGMPFKIRIHYSSIKQNLKDVAISFAINEQGGERLLTFWTETSGNNFNLLKENGYIDCEIESCPLVEGQYSVTLYSTVNGILSDYVLNAGILKVDDREYFSKGRRDHESHPKYVVNHTWSVSYKDKGSQKT